MGRKLYGKGIRPSCTYCMKGTISSTREQVFCTKKGIVPCEFSCWHFKYDPLKRVPNIPQELQKFSAEDFTI